MPNNHTPRYLDDPVFTLGNTAVALLNTTYLNYELAMALNHAYNLRLHRIDDCPVGSACLPCFIYHDRPTHLTFVLLDRPAAALPAFPFDSYDKMILVRGRDSLVFQSRLSADILNSRPQPPDDDLTGRHHWQLVNLLCQGIIDISTFSFFADGQPRATSLHSGPVETMSKRLTTYLSRLRQFLTDTFRTFEWALSNPEELC